MTIFPVAVVVIIILIWVLYRFNSPPHSTKLYFDYAATTFPTGKVLDTYRKFSRYGNLSQVYNKDMQKRISAINTVILHNFFTAPDDATLIWTSGGSESNNTVFNAVADNVAEGEPLPVILVGNTEHHTSYSCLRKLAKRGRIVWDIFSSRGDLARKLIAVPNVRLVSLMHVNNETGAVYDLEEVCEVVQQVSPNTLVHSDVVQSMGKRKLPLNLDYYSASAHKFGGVTGVGLLACSARGSRLIQENPLITGTQQNDMRGGTFNIAGAVSTYQALVISLSKVKSVTLRNFNVRDYIIRRLSDYYPVTNYVDYSGLSDDFGFRVDGITNGGSAPVELCLFDSPAQAPNILAFSVVKYGPREVHFCNLRLKDYCLEKGVIIATGSACSKGKSEVLGNLGMPFIVRCGFIRLSFDGSTSNSDVKKLVNTILAGIYEQL